MDYKKHNCQLHQPKGWSFQKTDYMKMLSQSKEMSHEYCCTIVKIGEVQPIEGSDFLGQVIVEGRTIVVRKDEIKEGDILFYVQNKEKYDSETIQTISHERIKIDKKLKPTIICDIDGTVAWMQNRSPYDQKEVLNDMPDIRMFQLLEHLHKSGVEIIFLSAREGTKQCKEDTIKWLNKYFKPKKRFFFI